MADAGESAQESASFGISIAGVPSLGCEETMKSGTGDSPQLQVNTGRCDFSVAGCFFWQQPPVFATAGRWQHPHEDF
jgi:hypothetical protein